MTRPVYGLAVAMVIGTIALTLHGCSPRDDGPITAAIAKQVARPFRWFRKPTVDDDDIQPMVRRFYKIRGNRPAWTHMNGPTSNAQELLEELSEAPSSGLLPQDYDFDSLARKSDDLPKALPGADVARARALAALDVSLTRNFLKYATHRASGQVNPLQLPADWHIKPRQIDAVKLLADAVEHDWVREALDSLDPADPQYRELRDALVRYRKIEHDGGWPAVPGGGTLKRGSRGPAVLALQQRLIATGDMGSGASGRFDPATEAAVKTFQSRYGFDPDGIVGPAVLEQLNQPVSLRIRQIELNLERRRWVPDSLQRGRLIEVNIPSFDLAVREGDRKVLGMRVVVGKQFSPTPIFSDEISYLVFNPYWNVPSKIAGEEILADVQKDPDYLQKNHMRLFDGEGKDAREVDPSEVHWDGMTPEEFKYAVRQDPGPENAVGHVKFMCPNQFDVYLHDTPATHLFSAEERGFSHGCIRVEQPKQLAEYLLRGKQDWDDMRIAAAMDTSTNLTVTIPEPMPVHVVYWTAFVNDQGLVQFRDDIYGLDSLLDRALRSRRPGI